MKGPESQMQGTILKELSNEQLIDVWESTEAMNGINISIIRGWLMDEIEKRFPEEFYAWLDNECPEDKDLRKYILK